MVSLFGGSQTDSLEYLRCKFISKKVVTTKSFVKPERLPPTTSAAKFHSKRSYFQVRQWIGKSDEMDPTEWGCDVQGGKLVDDDGQESGTRFFIENDQVQLLNRMYYKVM